MPQEKEFGDIQGIDIFAAGRWNGDEYSIDDLDKIVESFNTTKEKLKPYLKLGHGNEQKLLKEDELPAAGFVDRVYREGRKIMADISHIPSKIYELIKNRLYDKVSVELYKDIEIDGKVHDWALKAIALLGGATPAVHDLDSILALCKESNPILVFATNSNIRRYSFDLLKFQEDNTMQIEELQKKIAEMEVELKSFKDKAEALEAEKTKLSAEHTELLKSFENKAKELEKIQEEKRASEIDAIVSKFIEQKKIIPAQADKLKAILKDLPQEKKFTVGDKEYASFESLVLDFISQASPEGLPTDEKSQADGKSNLDEDAVIRDYMSKNKVSYKEAYIHTDGGKK